jgi:hypothetical protein
LTDTLDRIFVEQRWRTAQGTLQSLVNAEGEVSAETSREGAACNGNDSILSALGVADKDMALSPLSLPHHCCVPLPESFWRTLCGSSNPT